MSFNNESPEIFKDNIVNKRPNNKCLSKMKKPELYELCKVLVEENKKLQLFANSSDELLQSYIRNEHSLKNDISALEHSLEIKNKQILSLIEKNKKLMNVFSDIKSELVLQQKELE